MGTTASNSSLFESEEVKLRSGVISFPVLGNSTCESYEALLLSPKFKDFFLSNIDNDYLARSVLSQELDDQVFVSKLECCKVESEDGLNRLKIEFNNLQNSTRAGLNVKVTEALSILSRYFRSCSGTQNLPFVQAFQRRVSVLHHLHHSFQQERKKAITAENRRELPENPLNSLAFPQLTPVNALNSFAFQMLKLFPVMLGRLGVEERGLLVEQLCLVRASLQPLEDAGLYATWTPRSKMPMKPVPLIPGMLKASSGDPTRLLQTGSLAWVSGGGYLDIAFDRPTTISHLKIAWIPTSSTATQSSSSNSPKDVREKLGVPKFFTLFALTDADSQTWTKLTTQQPDRVKEQQGSLIQHYAIPCQGVLQLKLVVSGQMSASSSLPACHVYQLSLYSNNSNHSPSCIDTVQVMGSLLQALLPCLLPGHGQAEEVEKEVREIVFETLFHLLRVTGSLQLLLVFLQFLAAHPSLDLLAVLGPAATAALTRLLQAVDTTKRLVIEEFNRTVCAVPEDLSATVAFDERSLAETCQLAKEGRQVVYSEGRGGWAIISQSLEKGESEWELQVGQPEAAQAGNKGIWIGVACLPSAATSGSASKADFNAVMSNGWLLSLDTGELKARGEVVAASAERRPFLPADGRYSLRYNASTKFLSLSINNQQPYTVLFESVFSKAVPVVLFQGRTEVQATAAMEAAVMEDLPRTVSLMRFAKSSSSSSSKQLISPLLLDQPLVIPSDQLSVHLLQHLGSLAAVHLQFLQRSAMGQSGRLGLQYSLEVGWEVFDMLTELLELAAARQDEGGEGGAKTTSYLLELLHLQFFCLDSSCMSLRSIEIAQDVQTAFLPDQTWQEKMSFFAVLKARLLGYLKTEDEEMKAVKQQAMQVFCRGLDIFLPDSTEQIATIQIMLAEIGVVDDTAEAAASDELTPQEVGQYSVIVLLSERLVALKEVAKLVSLALETSTIVPSFLLLLWKHLLRAEGLSLQRSLVGESAVSCMARFIQLTQRLVRSFLEEVIYRIMQRLDDSNQGGEQRPILLLADLCCPFLQSSEAFLVSYYDQGSNGKSCNSFDDGLRSSFLGQVIMPLLHSFLLPGLSSSCELLDRILPAVLAFSSTAQRLASSSKSYHMARRLLSLSMGKQSTGPIAGSDSRGGGGGSSSGWRAVKAVFDESDSNFAISENGLVFTSLTPTNTCALVNIKFGPGQRGAWEFQLENDSLSDECSVFGVARKPVTSRCCSSSPDLWMRRAYNGYMYAQGSTTGQNMEKIHQGDIVRIEFDGITGSLQYSINGAALETGFTDIREEVYPCCGSYRDGVVVRLLKVEVYGGLDADSQDQVEDSLYEVRPSPAIAWIIAASEDGSRSKASANNAEPALLVHPLSREKSKDKASLKGAEKATWVSARGNRGVYGGRNEWSFELEEGADSPFAIGILYGPRLPELRLGGDHRLKDDHISGYSLAWWSDGSLWRDGSKVADGYGRDSFPLPKHAVIAMEVDLEEGTVRFRLNGRLVGTAFGPSGSGATVECILPRPSYVADCLAYPAASICRATAKVRLRTSGLHGSTVFPFAMSLSYSSAAIFSRIAAQLLLGSNMTSSESQLLPWLESPMFVGGLSSLHPDQTKLVQLAEELHLPRIHEVTAALISKAPTADTVAIDELLVEMVLSGSEPSLVLSTSVQTVYDWLDTIDAEPANMRKMLERSSNYRFPSVELPFLACLLKHGLLVAEAKEVIHLAALGQEASSCSEEMFLVRQKLKQLRTSLRRQRQKLKAEYLAAQPEEPLAESKDEKEEVEDASAVPVSSDAPLSSSQKKDESELTIEEGVEWKAIKKTQRSYRNDSLLVRFLQLAIDTSRGGSWYVKLEVIAKDKASEMPSALFDKAFIDDHKHRHPKALVSKRQVGYIQVNLWFEDMPAASSALDHITFHATTDDDAGVVIQLLSIHHVSVETAFQTMCQTMRKKAQLMFLLNSTNASSLTKTSLISLSSLYSTGSLDHLHSQQQQQRSLVRPDLSRRRTTDRWKRVVEFLHVHSKMKRQGSAGGQQDPSSSGHGEHALHQTTAPLHASRSSTTLHDQGVVSNAQAIIQACAVFLTAEEITWSAETVSSVLYQRALRAKYRASAFDAVASFLADQSEEDDPYILSTMLAYLQTSMQVDIRGKQDGKQKASHSSANSGPFRCLQHLEGCSASSLEHVNRAFSKMYTSLSSTLSSLINSWERDSEEVARLGEPVFSEAASFLPSINLIFRMWTISLSGRDMVWLNDCGILSIVHKLSSLGFYEKVVAHWQATAGALLAVYQEQPAYYCHPTMIKPWSAEFLETNCLQGDLFNRDLFMHLHLVANSHRLSPEERASLQLPGSIHDDTADDKTLQLTYCQLQQMIARKVAAHEAADKGKSPFAPCIVDEETMAGGIVDVAALKHPAGHYDDNDIGLSKVIKEAEELELFTRKVEQCQLSLLSSTARLEEARRFRLLSSLLAKFLSLSLSRFIQALDDVDEQQSEVMDVGGAAPPDKLLLLRDLTHFGTPRSEASSEAAHVLLDVITSLGHELLVASTYLANSRPGAPKKRSIAQIEDELLGMNEAGSSGNSSSSSLSPLLLESGEVEMHVNVLLNALNLIAFTTTALSDFSRPSILTALFLVLQPSCSGGTQIIALNILRKVLPMLDPVKVEEVVPSSMRAAVDAFETAVEQLGEKRKARRLPDYLVRYLFIEIGATWLPDDSDFPYQHPVGSGYVVMNCTLSKIALIKQLFESPLWNELVAHNLLNALRHVVSIKAGLSLDSKAVTMIYAFATAACSCLTSPSMLMLGALVDSGSSANPALATVIKSSPGLAYAEIVLQSNVKDFSVVRHIEKVAVNKLTLRNQPLKVDFAKMSQPVLSQLLIQIKALIEWLLLQYDKDQDTIAFIDISQLTMCKLKLVRFAFEALSNLLLLQTDIVLDFIHEANVLRLLGRLSVIAHPLSQTAQSVQPLRDLWTFLQQRQLETRYSGFSQRESVGYHTMLAAESGIRLHASSCSSGEDAGKSVTEPGEEKTVFEISHGARRRRRDTLQGLTEEPRGQLSSEDYTLLLEYYGGDVGRLQQQVAITPAIILPHEDSNWILQTKKETSLAGPAYTYSDDNLLKGLEHASSILQLMDDGNQGVSCADLTCTLEVFDEKNPDLSIRPIYLVQTADEGLARLSSEAVGLWKGSLGEGHLVMQVYHAERQVSWLKIVPYSSVKQITRWHGVKMDSISSILPLADLACCFLTIRRSLGNLLASNFVNSPQIFEYNDQAILGLKLLSYSSRPASPATVLPRILESFIDASEARPGQLHDGALVEKLIDDAVTMLAQICSMDSEVSKKTDKPASSSPGNEDDGSEEDGIRVASPHPFPLPAHSEGRIVLPDPWKGAVIRFHKSCCTPSPRASLQFFLSEKEWLDQKVSHRFHGPQSAAFQDIPVTDTKVIYYRFSAPRHSEKPLLSMQPILGPLELVDDCYWALKASSTLAVGLGDDESLFNLFEASSVNAASQGLLVCDCATLPTGRWFFEVSIVQAAAVVFGSESSTASFIGFGGAKLLSDELSFDLLQADDYLVLGQDGTIRVAIEEKRTVAVTTELQGWTMNDIICCLLETNEEGGDQQVSFTRNGVIVAPPVRVTSRVAWKPIVLLSGESKVHVNLGERPFSFPWRDISDGKTEPHPDHVDHALTTVRAVIENQEEVPKETIDRTCWGFDFVVQPVSQLQVLFSSEFDLVWSAKPEDKPGNSKAGEVDPKAWIWRAKTQQQHFLPMADIVTTTACPPLRGLLVDRRQCRHPKSFSCVFASSKAGIAVWRPICDENFVSLGDIVTADGSSRQPPSVTSMVCLPKWAVRKSEVPNRRVSLFRKVGACKSTTNASLWQLDNVFGHFFGSPYERRQGDGPRSTGFKVDDIGQGYTLLSDYSCQLMTDWLQEEDIIHHRPSLTWIQTTLQTLLQSSKWRSFALNERVFLAIVAYLKACLAAAPIKLVPLLIQMVRLAQQEQVSLPLSEVRGLCNAILNEALNLSAQGKKKLAAGEIPKALMSLVDFVVEIQAVHVLESSKRDRSSIHRSQSLLQQLEARFTSNDSEEVIKDEDEDGQRAWWDRACRLDAADLKAHRVIRPENLDNVFSKDSTLLKLKQALKFLYAMKKANAVDDRDPLQQQLLLFTERSYPKLLTTKLWFEQFSRMAFKQSRHPYRRDQQQPALVEKVSFPGTSS